MAVGNRLSARAHGVTALVRATPVADNSNKRRCAPQGSGAARRRVLALVLAGLIVLAFAGFRNGDFTGEALARALRADLEAAAGDAGEDRVPPR